MAVESRNKFQHVLHEQELLRGLGEITVATEGLDAESQVKSKEQEVDNLEFLMVDQVSQEQVWLCGRDKKLTEDGGFITVWELWCERFLCGLMCKQCGDMFTVKSGAMEHVASKHVDQLIQLGLAREEMRKLWTPPNTMPRRSREEGSLMQGREWAGAGRQRTRSRTAASDKPGKLVVNPESKFLRGLRSSLEEETETQEA